MAESEIFFELSELTPIVLDFKETEDKILAVTSGGKRVPYTFKNEHIIIQPEHLKEGRNEFNIQFIAGESSLNRSEDLMYTLLVPDRCRTLMPCFDQPDIKARFKLTLKIPAGWQAIANGEQPKPVASQGVAGVVGPRHCIEMVSGSIWKVTSQKVIILYTKPNQA